MFDSTLSQHIFYSMQIYVQTCLSGKLKRKPSVTLTKGGLTATPYNLLSLVKGGSNIFKGGLNPPNSPPTNRPLLQCYYNPLLKRSCVSQTGDKCYFPYANLIKWVFKRDLKTVCQIYGFMSFGKGYQDDGPEVMYR